MAGRCFLGRDKKKGVPQSRHGALIEYSHLCTLESAALWCYSVRYRSVLVSESMTSLQAIYAACDAVLPMAPTLPQPKAVPEPLQGHCGTLGKAVWRYLDTRLAYVQSKTMALPEGRAK